MNLQKGRVDSGILTKDVIKGKVFHKLVILRFEDEKW